MKVFLCLICAAGLLIFCLYQTQAAPATTNQPAGFRLTVELQDGSKIIGKSGDDTLQFRSDVLGEMKLPLERIRSIECQPKTNSIQLTTVNGDTLTAQFVTKVVRVETAFGNFKLPVNLIRRLTVSPMGKPSRTREGLVALWSGEGNGSDSVGSNNGVLRGDVGFAPGKVGEAFALDGNSAYVEVPGSPGITPNGPFTVMAWVNYLRTSGTYSSVIVAAKGLDAELPVDWALGIGPARKLRPHVNVGGNWVNFDCATTLQTGVWYHVAMVYDGANLRGYVNGVLDGTRPVSGALQATDNSLKVGAYAPVNGTASKGFFPGKLDEVSLYNRALSDSEIREDYETGKEN